MRRLNSSLCHVTTHVTTAVAIAATLTLALFVGPASAFVFDGDANNGSIVVTTADGLVHWLKHDPVSQIQGQFSTNVSVDGGVTDIPKALAVGDFDGDNNGDTSGDLFVVRPNGELLWLKTDAFNLNI